MVTPCSVCYLIGEVLQRAHAHNITQEFRGFLIRVYCWPETLLLSRRERLYQLSFRKGSFRLKVANSSRQNSRLFLAVKLIKWAVPSIRLIESTGSNGGFIARDRGTLRTPVKNRGNGTELGK